MIHERQHLILEKLKYQGFVSVQELCETLHSSGATIRRDLTDLEKRGQIKRVRGGAIAFNGINSDLPHVLRSNTNLDLKKHIAWLAANFVNDSSTLFMDSSSTTRCLAHEIKDAHNISVITNSVEIANLLCTNSQVNVYASGGHVRNNSTMVGSAALRMVQDRYADIFFFSCAGLSPEHGTSETNEESVSIKRAMFANASKRILLCDHSKFDVIFSYKCFGWNGIDVMITDRKPSAAFISLLPDTVKLLY